MTDLEALRQEFSMALDHGLYLDHAAVSPLPRAAQDEMKRYLGELGRQGAAGYPETLEDVFGQCRGRGARLLGTKEKNIFIVRSTSQGLSIPATGLPWALGDNVVLVEGEFPANLRPWTVLREHGVELRLVPQKNGRVHYDDLAEAIDDRTRVVSVSWVQFFSGYRLEPGLVAELCRRRDALFVLDGIQGLGAFSLDVESAGVDFLAADAHKWLMGPEGVGLGYASERALERITPAVQGWLSVKDPWNFDDFEQPLKETAARYEVGSPNTAGLFGMAASLWLLESVGVHAIGEQILINTEHLVQGLTASGWTVVSPRTSREESSGIVTCTREDVDVTAVWKALREEHIYVSVRKGHLRISPHGYNSVLDIERLLDSLSIIEGLL